MHHYLPLCKFVRNGLDGVEPGYEPKDDSVVIKTLYQLHSLDTLKAMEKLDLVGATLPNIV